MTSTGSYATTWTSPNDAWVADMVAFKAGTSGGTGCSGGGGSGCTSPTGVAGQLMYNSTTHVPQFCNGTIWCATQ